MDLEGAKVVNARDLDDARVHAASRPDPEAGAGSRHGGSWLQIGSAMGVSGRCVGGSGRTCSRTFVMAVARDHVLLGHVAIAKVVLGLHAEADCRRGCRRSGRRLATEELASVGEKAMPSPRAMPWMTLSVMRAPADVTASTPAPYCPGETPSHPCSTSPSTTCQPAWSITTHERLASFSARGRRRTW